MDIVKANSTQLKGSVKIESELGKGTTFLLRVPLTLSSERGLIVKCGGELMVIPVTNIEKVLMINESDIIEVEATQAIQINNHPIPLRNLALILGFDIYELINPEQLSIVIVKEDWNSVAFLVDEILGEKEIVIKPLQPPLSDISMVSGGTLAVNGDVMIVLNTHELIAKALHSSDGVRVQKHVESKTESINPHILVVDDSITTRTLEKNILESKKYQVTIAVNGKDAWDLLQKNKYALMITDINMPVMDGFALTERVKKSEELQGLPVIIVTSLGSDAEKKRGIEVGADAYVVKSEFESGELLKIVSQLI